MLNVSMSFLNGSTNFLLSSIKDYDSSACHQRGKKQHSEAVAAGISLPPRRVEQHMPPNSAIAKVLQQMDEKDWDTVEKLHEISFNITLQGLPFTALRSQVEIEELHGVNFMGSYENETACKTFIFGISECFFFEETVKKKLKLVNFITVLCDGSTGNSVTEQEVLYVIFVDPETFKPTIEFLEVVMPSDSQDAPGLKDAITATFKKHSLESVLKKMVFLGSDGASVNSGKNSGLIKLFQEELPWLSFIWCFSHWLDLGLKDALNNYMEPIETSLMHLFHLYKESFRKHRELKNLYELLQGQFEMFSRVRPLKASGTWWIYHKIGAMGRLIEKIGFYTMHLQNVITATHSSKDRSTLEGKFKILIDAKVLLRSSLFKDVLADAKTFSLLTQNQQMNFFDAVESTKDSYQRLPTISLLIPHFSLLNFK